MESLGSPACCKSRCCGRCPTARFAAIQHCWTSIWRGCAFFSLNFCVCCGQTVCPVRNSLNGVGSLPQAPTRSWEAFSEDALSDRVATELERGRLVFWVQGRMEWGPRALGNRSLLADPRREDMRELINAKVKLREPFRPFAPSVLEERAAEYFDSPSPSPFMLFTVPVLPSAKGVIPAVVHVDGMSHIQALG